MFEFVLGCMVGISLCIVVSIMNAKGLLDGVY